MALEPGQISFDLGGIPFGNVDSFGVDWSIEKFEGWTGATKSTSQLTQKPRQGGAWRSTGYSAARSVAASGKIFAPTPALLSAAFDRLNAAIPAGTDVVLTVHDAAGDRWATVQQSDDILTDWILADTGTWSIQVEAEDWRKFGPALNASTRLPATSGGLVITAGSPAASSYITPADAQSAAASAGLSATPSSDPNYYDVANADGSPSTAAYIAAATPGGAGITIPAAGITIDADTVTGQVNLTNPGNESGPVTLRIDGPCQGPVVTHLSTGSALVFSSSLVLQAGEFLIVDMDARTALANGTANRAGYITSRGWSAFDPGDNTWAFTAAQYNAASQLTVTAVPAWR